MHFEKWHGIGNAYLIIEESDCGGLELTAARVARICDPDVGAGSDGVLLVSGADRPRPRVRIFNPDGSEAEFSGNGTRIAAGWLMERRGDDEVSLVTIKGVIGAARAGGEITVDAGQAALESPDHAPDGGEPPASEYTFVSLGNPHCVIVHDGLEALDLPGEGGRIERHPWFPNRTNVEFFRPLAGGGIEMRVWERGAGETRSSGSGASAAAVAAVLGGHATSPVRVRLPGGELAVSVGDDLHVRLTGPVERICGGRFDEAWIAGLEAVA